jgi:hypothetical protein
LGKTNLSLQGTWDTYTYDENGRRINVPRWKAGKGIGRLRSTGTSYSYTMNNTTNPIKSLIALFSKEKPKVKKEEALQDEDLLEDDDFPEDDWMEDESYYDEGRNTRAPKNESGGYDADGYYINTVPWSLSFNYSLSLGYGEFVPKKKEYKYKFTQGLGISGSISPTPNWNINFNTNYDFDVKKFVTMQCTISRKMHCWNMSASVIPIGPYKSYSFTISASSSLLRDLKYDQSSSYYDAMYWGK